MFDIIYNFYKELLLDNDISDVKEFDKNIKQGPDSEYHSIPAKSAKLYMSNIHIADMWIVTVHDPSVELVSNPSLHVYGTEFDYVYYTAINDCAIVIFGDTMLPALRSVMDFTGISRFPEVYSEYSRYLTKQQNKEDDWDYEEHA